MGRVRLGVNIDHVATVRNARGGIHPDPVRAAIMAQSAGADGITAHLREDRRHISDEDISRLMAELSVPLNFEMAATDEMLLIALKNKPHACCIVPEKREELTTEGGLDVLGSKSRLKPFISQIKDAGIRVSLFIDPDEAQIEASRDIGADIVEIHTGAYCSASKEGRAAEFEKIVNAARFVADAGIECHAGHGLDYDTAMPVATIKNMAELNIGHFLVGEAIFCGLKEAIQKMRDSIDKARNSEVA